MPKGRTKERTAKKRRTKTSKGIEWYIEVDDLVKVYGDIRAVDGISLRIKKGEIFAFLGPNGAGKTTTVEIIETIRTPTEGMVKLMGMDISKRMSDLKKVIGVLPQEFSSFDKLKVWETLEFFSNLYNTKVDIHSLIKKLDLVEHKDRLYQNLSGGLKQRVGIAVSLVNDPEVVFLDEPTTGLDPQARHEVWKVIAELKKSGKTVFLTTHYMEEAEELADHIAIIHKGRIIAEGTVDELVDRYGSGLHLTFIGIDGNLRSIIKDMGLKVEVKKGDRITVKIEDKDELVQTLISLKDKGAAYNEINVRKANLEEVFLSLTGEELVGGDEE